MLRCTPRASAKSKMSKSLSPINNEINEHNKQGLLIRNNKMVTTMFINLEQLNTRTTLFALMKHTVNEMFTANESH